MYRFIAFLCLFHCLFIVLSRQFLIFMHSLILLIFCTFLSVFIHSFFYSNYFFHLLNFFTHFFIPLSIQSPIKSNFLWLFSQLLILQLFIVLFYHFFSFSHSSVSFFFTHLVFLIPFFHSSIQLNPSSLLPLFSQSLSLQLCLILPLSFLIPSFLSTHSPILSLFSQPLILQLFTVLFFQSPFSFPHNPHPLTHLLASHSLSRFLTHLSSHFLLSTSEAFRGSWVGSGLKSVREGRGLESVQGRCKVFTVSYLELDKTKK